jgi:signal transduction histidine kinase
MRRVAVIEVIDQERDASPPVSDRDGDTRATAVLAVLAGVAPDVVAARTGVDPFILDGWVRTFVESGRAGLAGLAADPPGAHRERYLGLVAHELRSPLAMIHGWADLLAEADDDPAVRARALAGIHAQVTRLRRLADDAADATSAALGQLRLHRQRVGLAAAVTDVVRVRSLDLPSVLVEEDVEVEVDLDRFGQILDNLLENARKHAHHIGRLVVRRRGGYGEIVLTSPGTPMPEAVAARIFEPFERGPTDGEGVGLGLFVCRSLVAAHGGRIGLRSDQDGNHFWIHLPVASAHRSVDLTDQPAESAPSDTGGR